MMLSNILNNKLDESPVLWAYLKKNYSGIGMRKAFHICKQFGFPPQCRLDNLTESTRLVLFSFLKGNFNKNAKIFRKNDIDLFIRTGHIKGFLFKNNLPMNSQRTRNNAKTRKKRQIF